MRRPEDDVNVMKALNNYLNVSGRIYPDGVSLSWSLDCVCLFIDDNLVITINLPPVSNYTISETKHTDKYLKKKALSAS
jgi:hypothetical protein